MSARSSGSHCPLTTPTSARTADAFINNSPPFFYRSHSRVRALGEADGRPGAPAVPAVVRATATVRPARPTTCSPARCTRDNHLYDASHPRTSRTSIEEVPAVTCLIRQEIPVSPPPSIICAAGVTPRPPAPLSVRCPPSLGEFQQQERGNDQETTSACNWPRAQKPTEAALVCPAAARTGPPLRSCRP